MDEAEAVDPSSLLLLRQLQKPGAPDVVGRILGRFLEETPQRMAALHSAVEHDDARALEQAAHALKGIAGTVGANEMASIAQELEQRGRAGATAGAQQRVEDLQAAFERAQPILNDLRLPAS